MIVLWYGEFTLSTQSQSPFCDSPFQFAYVTPVETACQIPKRSSRGQNCRETLVWACVSILVAEGYPAGTANKVTKARMAATTPKASRCGEDLLTVMATRHCNR
jgi:hypothetical protein